MSWVPAPQARKFFFSTFFSLSQRFPPERGPRKIPRAGVEVRRRYKKRTPGATISGGQPLKSPHPWRIKDESGGLESGPGRRHEAGKNCAGVFFLILQGCGVLGLLICAAFYQIPPPGSFPLSARCLFKVHGWQKLGGLEENNCCPSSPQPSNFCHPSR